MRPRRDDDQRAGQSGIATRDLTVDVRLGSRAIVGERHEVLAVTGAKGDRGSRAIVVPLADHERVADAAAAGDDRGKDLELGRPADVALVRNRELGRGAAARDDGVRIRIGAGVDRKVATHAHSVSPDQTTVDVPRLLAPAVVPDDEVTAGARAVADPRQPLVPRRPRDRLRAERVDIGGDAEALDVPPRGRELLVPNDEEVLVRRVEGDVGIAGLPHRVAEQQDAAQGVARPIEDTHEDLCVAVAGIRGPDDDAAPRAPTEAGREGNGAGRVHHDVASDRRSGG